MYIFIVLSAYYKTALFLVVRKLCKIKKSTNTDNQDTFANTSFTIRVEKTEFLEIFWSFF